MPTESKGPHIAQTEPGAIGFGLFWQDEGSRRCASETDWQAAKAPVLPRAERGLVTFSPISDNFSDSLLLDQTTQFVKPGAQLERSCFQTVYQPQLEILQGLLESIFVKI